MDALAHLPLLSLELSGKTKSQACRSFCRHSLLRGQSPEHVALETQENVLVGPHPWSGDLPQSLGSTHKENLRYSGARTHHPKIESHALLTVPARHPHHHTTIFFEA